MHIKFLYVYDSFWIKFLKLFLQHFLYILQVVIYYLFLIYNLY